MYSRLRGTLTSFFFSSLPSIRTEVAFARACSFAEVDWVVRTGVVVAVVVVAVVVAVVVVAVVVVAAVVVATVVVAVVVAVVVEVVVDAVVMLGVVVAAGIGSSSGMDPLLGFPKQLPIPPTPKFQSTQATTNN